MFSNTIGAKMSRDLKPYVAVTSGTDLLLKSDTADLDDDGTKFQAFVTSGLIVPAQQLGTFVDVGETVLVAKAQAGVTIQQTLIRDYGLENRTSTVVLTPAGSEARVIVKVEGSAMAQAKTLQVTLGDVSAVSSAWSLEALVIPLSAAGDL